MSTAVLGTPATAGPIAKVLKTEIERIHVQKNKDTSGQPAAAYNTSNEKKAQQECQQEQGRQQQQGSKDLLNL
jgi:hypothetical protein